MWARDHDQEGLDQRLPVNRMNGARLLRLRALLLAAWMVSPPSAPAQTVCRTTDTTSEQLRYHIGQYSSPTSTDKVVIKDSLRLGSASPSEVLLVSSESVCKKARDAYQQRLADRGGSAFSGRVYVLKVGTPYAVYDPLYRVSAADPFGIIVIMDSRYKPLSLFQ